MKNIVTTGLCIALMSTVMVASADGTLEMRINPDLNPDLPTAAVPITVENSSLHKVIQNPVKPCIKGKVAKCRAFVFKDGSGKDYDKVSYTDKITVDKYGDTFDLIGSSNTTKFSVYIDKNYLSCLTTTATSSWRWNTPGKGCTKSSNGNFYYAIEPTP